MENKSQPIKPFLGKISDFAQEALSWILIAIAAIGVTYLLICMGCSMWIVSQGLVQEQDMKYSSWLVSPTIVQHFGGFMSIGLSATLLLMGLAISVVRSFIMPFIVSIIICSVLQLSFNDQVVYSGGIYTNTIKVGCYVWEVKDCKSMLGQTTNDSDFSRYSKDDTSIYTPEYLAALASVKNKPDATAVGLLTMPGAYMLISPFTAMHFKEVKESLEAQRAELNTKLKHKN